MTLMLRKTSDEIFTKISRMEHFIHELNSLPDATRMGLLFGSLFAAIALESLIPFVKFEYRKLTHVATNMVFIITSGIVSLGLAFLAYEVIDITGLEFGLFYLIDIPLWIQLIISLVLLDFFGQYLIHACLHRYKWLWKLHLVHHSDTTVDASTGTRHHPGDILVRELLIFGVIVCVGIPAAFYILYRIITPFFAYFTHANIRLPANLDRALSWVIVTPRSCTSFTIISSVLGPTATTATFCPVGIACSAPSFMPTRMTSSMVWIQSTDSTIKTLPFNSTCLSIKQ